MFRKIEEITLYDHGEKQGFCLQTINCHESQNKSLLTVQIHPRFNRILRDVKVIKIVIADTRMKRSPAIKKIEVWGNPSESNSTEENEEILRLGSSEEATLPENADQIEQAQIDSDNFTIPEELLDSITNDLLTLPYILPSGNVVDQLTLDKHKKREEIFGRPPSDPFTGVFFTADSFPKFDPSLKMRLDEFKMKHSHEIEVKNSGRTLGRKEPCQPSTSGSSSHISKKIKLTKESASLDEIIQSIYRNKQISSFTRTEAPSQIPVDDCCSCKTTSNLYKITTCNHLFCKTCLTSLNLLCSACNESFENKNVNKFHS